MFEITFQNQSLFYDANTESVKNSEGIEVLGCYIRGTGKTPLQYPLEVGKNEVGYFIKECIHTHNGQVQEQTSTLVCLWSENISELKKSIVAHKNKTSEENPELRTAKEEKEYVNSLSPKEKKEYKKLKSLELELKQEKQRLIFLNDKLSLFETNKIEKCGDINYIKINGEILYEDTWKQKLEDCKQKIKDYETKFENYGN